MPAFSVHNRPAGRRILQLEIGRIVPGEHQPRRCFDEAELKSLAESMRRFGQLSPLLVRPQTDGRFELIAGERRLRALKMLGRSHAEVLVSGACSLDCALIAIIENLQREDLHYLDEAEACRRILAGKQISREELAASLGKSTSALANLLRLLRLPPEVKDFLRTGRLSERHARTLLQLKDAAAQLEFARRAEAEQLSVRQLEALLASRQKEKKPPAKLPCAMLRDSRLVINAFRDTVRQLRRIGVPASSRVENHGDHYDIIVTIRPVPEAQEN